MATKQRRAGSTGGPAADPTQAAIEYVHTTTPLDHLRHAIARLARQTAASGGDYTRRGTLEARAVQTLEAVALAIARGDAKGLTIPARWATAYLDARGDEDERFRFHGLEIAPRTVVADELLRVAKMASARFSPPFVARANSPSTMAQMMATTLAMHGLAAGRHEDQIEKLRVAIKRDISGAGKKLDAHRLVRLALVCFAVVRTHRDANDWLKSRPE